MTSTDHPLDPWLDSFERHCRLRELDPESIKVYVRSVRQLIDHVTTIHPVEEPDEITRDDIESWSLAMLDAGKAPATRRVRLLAARVFFTFVLDEPDSEITANPAAKVPIPVPREEPRDIPLLDDVQRLVKSCEGKDWIDVRDMAIVLMLLDTGLRRAELTGLDVDDVDTRTGVHTVRRGKGNRFRRVATGDQATLALARYIRIRRRRPASGRPELFLSTRPDRRGSWRLTPGGIALILARRCEHHDIPKVTPHQLRHLWADRVKRTGLHEADMSMLAGWSPGSKMPARYGAALAEERALESAKANSPVDGLGL